MAIPWIVALKSIPWGTVIEHGPKVLDKARDMVNRRRDAKESAVYSPPETDPGRQPTVEDLSNQIVQMQLAFSALSTAHEEMRHSLSELKQQNLQLVLSVKSLRRRITFVLAGLVVSALVLSWKTWLA